MSYDTSNHDMSLRVLRITRAIRASCNDMEEATEYGAYGVALLAVARVVGATFAERSYKGPGYDFHLLPPGAAQPADPDDIFGNKWALEVSGTLAGGTTEARARMRKKRKQVAEAKKAQPTLVAIVEFSEPAAIIEMQ